MGYYRENCVVLVTAVFEIYFEIGIVKLSTYTRLWRNKLYPIGTTKSQKLRIELNRIVSNIK